MIKILTVLFLSFFLVSGTVNAQYNIRDRYERKYHEYNHMKVKGIVFLSVGAVVGAGAAALFIKGNELQNADPVDVNTAEDYYWGGISVGCISIPFLLAGGILTPIGAAKSREYKKLLEKLSVRPVYTTKMQGISLVYRF
jgi:NADH:ubiquinone oxidoreductase subunit 5 (subunit L)/multisubunit Na+/H+ antiporter MnhA subunit